MTSDANEKYLFDDLELVKEDSLLFMKVVFLVSSSISLLIYSSKITVHLGRGALSMFLTIFVQDNLHVVLVSLTEEDLLVFEEIDFSREGLLGGGGGGRILGKILVELT